MHLRLFRNAALVRALLSFGGAYTAEWAFTVAISLVAYADGGVVAVGLVGLLRLVPAAIFAPAVATYADRLPREQVLFYSSAVRGVATLLVAPVLLADGPTWIVYAPGRRLDDRLHALPREPLRPDAAAVPGAGGAHLDQRGARPARLPQRGHRTASSPPCSSASATWPRSSSSPASAAWSRPSWCWV